MTFRRLQEITNSQDDNIYVDLSAISIDLFNELRDLILEFGPKKIVCLSINCSTAVKYARKLESTRKGGRVLPPAPLEGSIYSQHHFLEADIVALMARVLPKSKSLKSLSFNFLEFTATDIDILAQSLSLCTSLRTLKFQAISLNKNEFQRLAQSLHHQFVMNLAFKKCNLNDQVFDSFIELINVHTTIQKAAERKAEIQKKPIGLVCLSNIDLRGNNFSKKFVQSIVPVIDSAPVYRVDLRDNYLIPSTFRISPKIVVGATPQISSLSITSSSSSSKRKTPSSAKLRKERELEIENRKLKRKLDMFDSTNVASIDRKTFVIGERANELATHICELDKLTENLTVPTRKPFY